MSSFLTPRSPEEPMAFTPGEARRGAIAASVIFTLLLTLYVIGGTVVSEFTTGATVIVTLLLSSVALVVAGLFSLIIAFVLLPLAMLIGRALRRIRPIGIHLATYAVLGASLGTIIGGLIYGGMFSAANVEVALSAVLVTALFFGVITGLAVPLGWWFSARRALRDDRRLDAT
ncbi:MAG: hypothetical protein WAK00_03660 [Microbacterium sp.]|uniref:hypothetical protein n=1 Tax=Microbacterium sp. TaxID=51671 RepID=UPI003BAEE6DE